MLSRCALQVLTLRSLPSELPPVFLAPLLASTTQALHKRCSFSTTSPIFARTKKRRDGNADRGVSALRRTGLRRPVDMSFQPLPKPVLDPQRRSKVQVDPNHGLWGFFNQDRKALNTPEQDNAHGRPWTVEELRHKSWEDLHSLWWICIKGRNRLATGEQERKRMHIKTGDHESHKRNMDIRKTQQCIKHVLTERWYAWENAWKVAHEDPEVDLTAEPGTSAYKPVLHEEQAEREEAPHAALGAG